MKKTRKNIFIAVAALICFLILISGINKPHFSPFTTTLRFEGVNAATSLDDLGVVVDKQHRRLIIGDNAGHVNHVVDVTAKGSPINKISTVTIHDGLIYVTGDTLYNQGSYISSEKVLVYDRNGSLKEELFSEEYPSDEYVSREHFNSLTFIDGVPHLIYTDDNSFRILCLTDGSTVAQDTLNNDEYIYRASYFPKQQTLSMFMRSQNACLYDIEDAHPQFMSIEEAATELFSAEGKADHLPAIREIMNQYGAPRISFDNEGAIHQLTFLFFNCEDCVIYDFDSSAASHFSSLSYGTWFFISNLLFWISLLGILVLVGMGIVVLLRGKKLAAKRSVIYLLGIVFLTSAFYTYNNFIQLSKQYSQTILTQTSQFSNSMTRMATEKGIFASDLSDGSAIQAALKDPDNQTRINTLQEMVEELCAANGSDYSFYAYILAMDGDGNLYTMVDSMNNAISGIRISTDDGLNGILEGSSQSISRAATRNNTSIYSTDYFYDADGMPLGIVLVGCFENNLISSQINQGITNFVTLSVLLILLFVCINACKTFLQDFKRYRSRTKDQVGEKAVDMSSIFVFLYMLASSMDSIIMVYVAQSLCVGMDPAKSAALASLPMAMQLIGAWLGTLFYPNLSKRMGERSLAVFSSIAGIASLLFVIYSIQISSISLYIIAKLIYGIFVWGILYMLGQALPLFSSDEQTKNSAINSTQNATIAASILSMVLGGYISEYLSYSAIYALSAIMVGLLLVLSLFIFNKETMAALTAIKSNIGSSNHKKGSWKLFTTAPMLVFLALFTLPSDIVLGYSTYLFPLYSASCGMTVVLLSNIGVFSKTLCYILGDTIEASIKKYEPRKMLSVSILTVCLAMICFLISPNIYWAILLLFMIDILQRIDNTLSTIYVCNLADEFKCDEMDSLSNFYSTDSILTSFQSPIMSAFLSLGYNVACAAVGAVCGFMALIFTIYNNRRKKT